MTRTLVLLMLCFACQSVTLAADAACSAATPLRLRVRFDGEATRDVLLESTLPSGFRLLDPVSGEQLWSAGPGPSSTQRIAGLDSAFGVSITAVHLDADGVHDRLYAGDRAGRIWRFDLHNGAKRTEWLESRVLADLGAPGGGRGFVARPDVTRIDIAGRSWLNIAIGTANTAAPRNDHRFFVLRDAITGTPGPTLHESDLEMLSPPAGTATGTARGYYLTLGSAQVLAQALTLDGRIHFTTAESARNLIAACSTDELPDTTVPLSVTVLRARDGEVSASLQNDGGLMLRRPLANPLPASTGVALAASPAAAGGLVPCMIGTERLAGCALDTQPQRSWWRREDAD